MLSLVMPKDHVYIDQKCVYVHWPNQQKKKRHFGYIAMWPLFFQRSRFTAVVGKISFSYVYFLKYQ